MINKNNEQFKIQVCDQCQATFGHPVPVCRECLCTDLYYTTIRGLGTIYAKTTIHVPGSDHKGQEPFKLGLIDIIDGDVRVIGRINTNNKIRTGDTVQFIGTEDDVFYFKTLDE